jgi:hypothetical protein
MWASYSGADLLAMARGSDRDNGGSRSRNSNHAFVKLGSENEQSTLNVVIEYFPQLLVFPGRELAISIKTISIRLFPAINHSVFKNHF